VGVGLLRIQDDAGLNAGGRPALIGFWADWCVPSRGLAADLEAVAGRFGERLSVALADVDQAPLLKGRFAVRGLPTLVLLQGGREALRRVGLVPRDALLRLVERSIGP
jgi:thioredoxin-like negative regulator of GroEL